MDYLLISLGFLTTLIATLGKTKNSAQEGIRALTPLGWGALAISALVVGLTALKTYSANEKMEAAASELKVNQKRAHEILRGELRNSLAGLDFIYRQCSSGASFNSLDDLKSTKFIACLRTTDLLQKVNDPNAARHGEGYLAVVVARETELGLSNFRNAFQYHQGVLDPALVIDAANFKDQPTFKILIDPDLVVKMAKKNASFPYYLIEKDMPDEQAYLDLVEAARSLEKSLGRGG